MPNHSYFNIFVFLDGTKETTLHKIQLWIPEQTTLHSTQITLFWIVFYQYIMMSTRQSYSRKKMIFESLKLMIATSIHVHLCHIDSLIYIKSLLRLWWGKRPVTLLLFCLPFFLLDANPNSEIWLTDSLNVLTISGLNISS